MNVLDLIKELEKVDPFLEVIIDATDSSESEFFQFLQIKEVECCETEYENKYCVIFPVMMQIDQN